MGWSAASLVHFLLSLAPLFFLSTSEQTAFIGVSLENPTINLVPSSQTGYSCERVHVMGTSRLNLKSYASSLCVTLAVSDAMPEKMNEKVEVCFHRNASIGPCQLDSCEWRNLKKGQWKTVISPYEKRYIDVKFKDKAISFIQVSAEEEFHRWRLFCLGFGFFLWFLAPTVSNWVPFYYSSSMALGVLLVVLLILFQGMKLLPMGRKSALYLTFYGSMLGIGSYIAHYFSTVVNSILESFGLSDEMHNPVSVFLVVGLFLAGAALGYWTVRKYILSEDGSIDAGTAQFVKWAMRIISGVSILLSSLDSLLSVVALGICCCTCSIITSKRWRILPTSQYKLPKNENLWKQRARKASASKNAELLSRPATDFGSTVRGSSSSPYAQSNSQTKAHSYSSSAKMAREDEDHYSTFHKTPTQRKFSKREWEDFTRESTRDALAEWAASPEVAKWVADNAHRMRLDAGNSSDDSMESASGSSEETAVENGNGRSSLLKWY
ncbi:uncharacterized protein M6B38_203870 [Iris pallida]|uniref:Uncharacterized protein n=1 Tax=Iris pallida TaxID=29817 RepID=A0AAX6E6V9_IRIPA|nr:uncharacterized protein M6B38_203865 [Iris pallida]KAJ6799848.1 uncharacterized protein M6B38_203870 [Iris pallida]